MEFTADDYYPPQWSALPAHIYYFEIIKEGNLLGKIQVKDKEFNLIGRLEDLCDIFIDNPMVSRKHAILQAKQNEDCLYLMDLGSQHGTFVNKIRLPPRTYKKIEPFDSLKFGVSSRVFILRCPEYEQMKQKQENQKQNEFSKLLEEQHRSLSKQQLKAKYLDMLQNDPYFAVNQAPRKLMGRQEIQVEDEYQGIDWGITDQRQIYAYKNQNDFPIEPDLLRRLNLDTAQLKKLAEYEDHLRKYQEVQAELNEISSKEKRQFGLQQKLRDKKEKLEKRFVEALQTLQKNQEWLRSNIFGEVTERNKNKIAKQQQNDTFGDDIFLDRTLENKQVKIQKKEQVFQSQSYWALQAKLKSQIQSLYNNQKKLQDIKNDKPFQNILQQNKDKIVEQQEQDELDIFMKQNKKQTDESNIEVLLRQIKYNQATIEEIKNKLANIVGSEQVNKIANSVVETTKLSLHQLFSQQLEQEHIQIAKKKMQENKNIQDILNKIEKNQHQQQEVDEDNVYIFKYYKSNEKQDDDIELDEEQLLKKIRNKREHYDPTVYEKPIYKMRKANDQQVIKVESEGNHENNAFEQDIVDLTKILK